MSTATVSEVSTPLTGGKAAFLLRRLHSLTGLVFGGYLIVHLLVNATIAQGGSVYQTQVDKIHSLPFLPMVEWSFIFLPIIFHTIYGVWITLSGQPNAVNYPYAKNIFYVAQRASALVIVLFMLFHVLSLKYGLLDGLGVKLSFDPHKAMASVGTHMNAGAWIVWIVYPLGILASCYHLANGFWTAAITWGLTISKGSQQRWGYVCSGLFLMIFIAGMISLVAAAQIDTGAVVAPMTGR